MQAGDIVLIRTRWGCFFGVDNARSLQGELGIDVPAARCLTRRDVVAIGCDNMAVEALPNPDRGVATPVHPHVLVESGVHLIENLALEELARNRSARFCFILLAAKFKGATGCPVRLMALV